MVTPPDTGGRRPDRQAPVALLGPQRHRPMVAQVLDGMDVQGPVAVVTAGWEQREGEDAELDRHLSGRTVNLGLFPRTDEVLSGDQKLGELMVEREQRRRQLRDLYQIQLSAQLDACRQLLELVEPDELDQLDHDPVLGPEVDHGIELVRELDRHHLARLATLDAELDERRSAGDHPLLDRHRDEVRGLVADCQALLVAGGHIGVLSTALRMFGVVEAVGDRPVVGWSGGAMVLADRIVLFHDRPARGAGDAEVYGRGLGLVPNLVVLPHASHRLDLDSPRRVAIMSRRFAPDVCAALDTGDAVIRSHRDGDERWIGTVRVLEHSGRLGAPPGADPSSRPGTKPVAGHNAQAEGHSVVAGRTETGSLERAMAEITAAARSGPTAIHQVLERRGCPVVGDGWALFVYRGAVDGVRLHHWIHGLSSALPFVPISGTDVWTLPVDIAPEARVEYKLEVQRGSHSELIRDPLNPHQARDPFGANSVVRGFRYVTPEWTAEQPTARRGTVVDHDVNSKVFGSSRPYSVYLPARYRPDRPHPLVVVHDGGDYVNYASLIAVLDNLIHRLEIPPLIAALIQSPNRLPEYGANLDHARYLVDELLPDLQSRYLIGPPSRRVLLGASFGGVASLHAAWSHPGVFDKLLLQSGSFVFSDVGVHDRGPVFDPVVEWMSRFRADPGRPAQRIFLSVGVYESLVYYNRSILPILQSTGAEVRLVEALDGHNWENWRDHLRDGLTWLLPGPQWMIYE